MLIRRCQQAVRRFTTSQYPSRITREEYQERRRQLEKAVKDSTPTTAEDVIILLRGSQRSYIAPDVPHAFRQCSHFRYVTGLGNIPGCSYAIHISSSGRSRRVLFADRRSTYDQLWEGTLPSPEDMERTAGFDDLVPTKDLEQTLRKMSTSATVLFAETEQWTHSATSPLSVSSLRQSFASIRAVHGLIDKLRVVKSEAEIQSMDDVCSMGARMMSASIAGSLRLQHEGALVGLLEFEARRRGAEMLAYPPVVAAGNRANTIHYLDANRDIANGDCVLVDAGCDLNGYVSDITRCWPVGGRFSPVQREVYEALRDVHEQLLEYAHTMGKVRLSSLFRRMVELLAANMMEVGVIPKSTDSQQILQLAEELCPHHVSHYLGMDVHDCPTVSRDIDLPPGVVFTIEPGVYIPSSSTVFPAEFRGMGFRIEDDVVTTAEGGIRVLSDEVPREAAELEYLMNPM